MGATTQYFTTKSLLEATIKDACSQEPRTLFEIMPRMTDVHILDAQKELYDLERSGRVSVDNWGRISLPKKSVQ